ncbi:hypothetical protein [Brachybacterium sacelli]|uniref:Uncharacterized protein n=1 Tax=Brachybacterium sacelli TaxID=173364 RepID=A0ABS4WY33_9MICO|nr:hypothetical protein [Brachybacterium sacelli]MBP2381120.1 hypothetical protein [Brachybacterium sacelli]
MMTVHAFNHRWTNTPVAQRILLWLAILFGFLGVLNAAIFLTDMTGPTVKTYQWAAAVGLAVAVNAVYWLFAWREGTFRRVGRVLLAAALLLCTFFALYAGLQGVLAGYLGVGLLDA